MSGFFGHIQSVNASGLLFYDISDNSLAQYRVRIQKTGGTDGKSGIYPKLYGDFCCIPYIRNLLNCKRNMGPHKSVSFFLAECVKER